MRLVMQPLEMTCWQKALQLPTDQAKKKGNDTVALFHVCYRPVADL